MKRTVRILGMGFLLVAGFVYATGWRKQTNAATLSQPQMAHEMAAEVKIDNFSFGPATLEIKAGTKVTWTNADDIPHTVVSNDKVFKSKALDTDEKFSFTFDKPGTYPYFCSLHPKMTAKVVVQ
ncbi:MAG TPA: cupredoxin family copper-binding protein [Candidatus Dormibacteraeota bacterium]|jgi:plastocyanin|nr:cupredoxin family copper-binding protein [Candidatus Dormibacteraeota bacterium]